MNNFNLGALAINNITAIASPLSFNLVGSVHGPLQAEMSDDFHFEDMDADNNDAYLNADFNEGYIKAEYDYDYLGGDFNHEFMAEDFNVNTTDPDLNEEHSSYEESDRGINYDN